MKRDRFDVFHDLVAVLRGADEPERGAVSQVEGDVVECPGEHHVIGEQVIGSEDGSVAVCGADDSEGFAGEWADACRPPRREWDAGPRLATCGPGGDAMEVRHLRLGQRAGTQLVEGDPDLAEVC